MLNLAIIGMGWAGSRQLEASRELNRKLQVTCLIDNDAEFLQQQAAKYNISKTDTDYRQALADPAIDAVSICVPHQLHHPIALDAAAAGKHILVEKPMAMTVEEASDMLQAAAANQVKLYVAEQLPYSAMSRLLRDVVQSGKYIGELTAAGFAGGFRTPNFGYPGRRNWLTQPQYGGTGTWMLHGIHSMAQLRFIFGEVETVYMQHHHASSFERPDIEGTMSGLLTLESGVAVSVLQTCETKLQPPLGGYTIHGDQGSVRSTKDGIEIFRDGVEPGFEPYPPELLSPYALELEAFADYVNEGAVGPTTGTSERRSLAIVQAGYESAAEGRPIHLPTRFGHL